MLDSAVLNYTISGATPDTYEIMVRAVKLENTSSGTFYNLSSGEKVIITTN